jgi:serine phosphatase RsbU (regulator of sigma subunit)/pSer/pThr/pTyr-binding forkhead associated (FHA) protein
MAKKKRKSSASVSLGFLTGSRKGTSFVIEDNGEYRLGRDPECEIHLPEPNVSRVHARLVWDGTVLKAEDLKSTNGVFVNGERIETEVVRHNDVVAVGPCVFRVSLSSSTASSLTVVDAGKGGGAPNVPPSLESEQFQHLFECMLAIQRILSEDSENMVEACLDTLFLALPVTRLCLLKVNERGEHEPWLTRTKSGMSREFVMSKTFARKVREKGSGLIIHDALHLDSAEWGHTMQQQEVRSILGVPVFSKEAMIAILLCDNLEKPNILSDVHVRTIEFFAKALETVFQRERIRSLEESQTATERQFLAARRVQKQIFTKRPAAEMGGLRWALQFRSALEVGGDFHDFAELGDHTTWIVADVTGKGISAALVVSMLKGFCKTLFPKDLSPHEMLVRLNNLMMDELPPEMFLTALVCRTTPDGRVVFCNAGHQPLYVIHSRDQGSEEAVERLKPPGVPLGFLSTAEFRDRVGEHSCQLVKGDKMLLYTDGVSEAVNSRGEFFGEKRLNQELAGVRDLPAVEALARLWATLEQFQGTAAQHDDITMVLGEY